jgi:transcriptional antiterminator NusG
MTIAETPEETTEVEQGEAPAEEAEAVAAIEDSPEVADEVAPVEGEADESEASDDAAPVGDEGAAEGDADGEAVEVVEEPPMSPYDLPGDWYVVHSYSGYENKVKLNLETRSKSMHMEDLIYEVVIPMEDVVEIKNGKKVTVPRKMFPGYILVRMYLDDDSWYAVRNTPGVTGFVGSANKPVPLSRREVERFLGVKEEEDKKAPRFKPSWEIGDSVRVQTGPFADFNGVIEDINLDQSKVVVLVNIFGRDTPVELNFEDIIKN